MSFSQQCRQGEAQELAECSGNGLPIPRFTGFEPSETLHQIKRRTVNLDRINRRPAMEPLAPSSRISGAPLPKGGSFLNHRPSRSA
jgi:hypothetical protein